jgi:hypothetical protein
MDLLEKLMGDRVEAQDTEMKKRAAEEELHGACKHPVEIEDVRRSMKRRNAVNLGFLGTVFTFLVLVVAVAVYAATIETNQTHLQTEAVRAREAREKEGNDRRSEDQAIRSELNQAQRANAKTHQELTKTMTRIETLLDVIADDSKRRRR